MLVGHVAREPGFEATLAAGQSIAHAEEYVYTFFNDDPDPKNEIVHPLDTAKIPKAVAMTREAGISVIPTLVAFHNIVRQATDVKAYLRDPNLAYMPPFMRAQLEPAVNTYANRWPYEKLAGLAVSYEFQRQLVKALHDGGVPDPRRDRRVVARRARLQPDRGGRELPGARVHALRGLEDGDGRSGEAPAPGRGVRDDRGRPARGHDPDPREPARGRAAPPRRRRRDGQRPMDLRRGAAAAPGRPAGVLPRHAGAADEGRRYGSAGARRVPRSQRPVRRDRRRRPRLDRLEPGAAGARGAAPGRAADRSGLAARARGGGQSAGLLPDRTEAERRRRSRSFD